MLGGLAQRAAYMWLEQLQHGVRLRQLPVGAHVNDLRPRNAPRNLWKATTTGSMAKWVKHRCCTISCTIPSDCGPKDVSFWEAALACREQRGRTCIACMRANSHTSSSWLRLSCTAPLASCKTLRAVEHALLGSAGQHLVGQFVLPRSVGRRRSGSEDAVLCRVMRS